VLFFFSFDFIKVFDIKPIQDDTPISISNLHSSLEQPLSVKSTLIQESCATLPPSNADQIFTALKIRILSELSTHSLWNNNNNASSSHILSCCRQHLSDFPFNSTTFSSDLSSFLSQNSLHNHVPIIHVDLDNHSNLESILNILNDDTHWQQDPIADQIVLISSGYDRRGSPFYGCGTGFERSNSSVTLGRTILEHPRVKLWWVSNHECDWSHYKLRYLPLGAVENCCNEANEQQLVKELESAKHESYKVFLDNDDSSNSSVLHDKLIFVSLGLKSGYQPKIEHRKFVIDSLSTQFVGLQNQFDLSMKEFFVQLHKYVFIASPKGLASDCYRHYHALLSGSIPLVDSHHSINQVLNGLPVIFVDDWTHVDLEFLINESCKLLSSDTQFAWDKLTNEFWAEKIVESASISPYAV